MKAPNNNKCWVAAGLVVLFALAAISTHFIRKVGSHIYIHAFNSVGAIPSSYWLDLQTVQHGVSFIGPLKDRIVLGSVGDLTKEFWSFVDRDKASERSLCGVKVVTLLTDSGRSVLITDRLQYMYFVGSPQAIPEGFINVLCANSAS